jgi:peptidoglycan/xylan/chitin deacetylase (PgdA/CDA1 family)
MADANQGTFALTFDTELIWGSFDSLTPAEFQRLFPDVRGTIDATLALLGRYEVPATWAIVGHLYLDACRRDASGRAHPELVHPGQAWFGRDWYAADPCTDRAHDPLWYGDDVVAAIQAAGSLQEIGCHSFAHALFDDPELTEEAVRSDLGACLDLARRWGITLRSFVFPRNREGHHALLAEHGFRAFRGADPTWHAAIPGPAGRLAHLADQAAGLGPPVSMPTEKLPGLWNIPGSMLFMHRTGVRRFISRSARIRKARAGLDRAARHGGVFHLWTHPFNIASDRSNLLATLETILQHAVRLRDADRLRFDSMGGIAERMSATPGSLGPDP